MLLIDQSEARTWFDWWNFWVGNIGLLLTVWAVLAATGAKKAAQEAKAAVWKRDATIELGELVRLADLVEGQIDGERPIDAVKSARDLAALLSRIRGRFPDVLAAVLSEIADLSSFYLVLASEVEGMDFNEIADFGSAKAKAAHARVRLNGVYGNSTGM